MRIQLIEEKRFETHLACSKSTGLGRIRKANAGALASIRRERWVKRVGGALLHAGTTVGLAGDGSGVGGGGFCVRKAERRCRGEGEGRELERERGSGSSFRVSGPRASPLLLFPFFFLA